MASMIIGAIGWNLSGLDAEDAKLPRFSDSLARIGEYVGIDQNWGMFAPKPPSVDWWIVIECFSPTNKTFEVFRNSGLFNWKPSAINFNPPSPFYAPFYNHRWSKYWEAYVEISYESLRPTFSLWLCNNWNSRYSEPDKQLARFNVWMVSVEHCYLRMV